MAKKEPRMIRLPNGMLVPESRLSRAEREDLIARGELQRPDYGPKPKKQSGDPFVHRKPDSKGWHVIEVEKDFSDEFDDPFLRLYEVLRMLASRYPRGRVWISAYGMLIGSINGGSGASGMNAHKTIMANSDATRALSNAERTKTAASDRGISAIEEREQELFREVAYYTVRYKER